MHNIIFVNKANFVKVYNNFVLKWLILALCVVTRTDIVREHLEDTLRICDVSAKGLYRTQILITYKRNAGYRVKVLAVFGVSKSKFVV